MERDFKGIWIPREIWLNKELTMNEKLFLIEIDSLDNENGCFASNDYFSEFFGLSKSRCSEIIHALEKKGILSVILQYKTGSKAVEKRIIKVFDKSKGYSENRSDLFGKSKGYSEKAKDNNTPINNTITNNTIKKEKKETDFDILIKEYTTNKELKTNIYEFIKMRKAKKAVLTTRALKLMLNKLNGLATNDSIKIKILDNTIMNGWSGVFALKDDYKEVKKQYGNTKQDSKSIAPKTITGEGEELAKRAIEKYGDKLQDFECEF